MVRKSRSGSGHSHFPSDSPGKFAFLISAIIVFSGLGVLVVGG